MPVYSAQLQTGATGNATWKGGGYNAAQLPAIIKETLACSKPYYHTQPGSTEGQADYFILHTIVSQTCWGISY